MKKKRVTSNAVQIVLLTLCGLLFYGCLLWITSSWYESLPKEEQVRYILWSVGTLISGMWILGFIKGH